VRFADLPAIEGATGKFLLQQMAAVAELEAGMISARTKAALAAAKRRGVKLGGDRGVRLTAKARAAGCESLRAISAELEARGIPAARGGKWSAVQVSRLLERVNPSTVQRISRPFDGASVAVA
jgi:DNA invertase Pin-like site-specific DNA recombinase